MIDRRKDEVQRVIVAGGHQCFSGLNLRHCSLGDSHVQKTTSFILRGLFDGKSGSSWSNIAQKRWSDKNRSSD